MSDQPLFPQAHLARHRAQGQAFKIPAGILLLEHFLVGVQAFCKTSTFTGGLDDAGWKNQVFRYFRHL